ncbi:MAG TPA: NUDIX domain-containing protein [Prolixibacteraceae bacterium]|nr:NUDIX domain-containing protein [Prolixibacteraceae bacterium]
MEQDINSNQSFLRHVSLDCVMFGFHENQLKVLLLRMKKSGQWALPGGFVQEDESLEVAASRVLRQRTGLDKIFLRQFNVFSDPQRSKVNPAIADLVDSGMSFPDRGWFNQRFISVGFYALVEFSLVQPQPDPLSDICEWINLEEIGTLMMDHNLIVSSALETLRLQLSFQPIGYTLLPEKFTMSELRRLYETILGKELDRRNFQRKMLTYNILTRLDEVRQGAAHKAPVLYRFHVENYQKALAEGLNGRW